jgi:hypothetical protein
MADLNPPFEVTGILRGFTDGRSSAEGRATFSMEVGNLSIPCHMRYAAGTPPKEGQRMHVVGAWTVAEDRSLCVEVHAMYPAREMRLEERRVIA